MIDPIIKEVREARQKHAERFNYDLHAICEDLKKKEKNCKQPVKSLQSKKYFKPKVGNRQSPVGN